MPAYNYKCEKCGEITEIKHGFNESAEGNTCSVYDYDDQAFCLGKLKKSFSATPAIFKGGGWGASASA